MSRKSLIVVCAYVVIIVAACVGMAKAAEPAVALAVAAAA